LGPQNILNVLQEAQTNQSFQTYIGEDNEVADVGLRVYFWC